MSKRIPVSAATKAWRLLDETYPGLMELLEGSPDLTTSQLAGLPAVGSFAIGAQAYTAGWPYDIGESDEEWMAAYRHCCALAAEDPRFFPLEELAWVARWKACKRVYRFDPVFAGKLEAASLETDAPIGALRRLPHPIVYVDRKMPVAAYDDETEGVDEGEAVGFFAYLDKDEAGYERLSIVYVLPDLRRVPVFIGIFKAETVGDLLSDAMHLEIEHPEGEEVEADANAKWAEMLKPCISKALALVLHIIDAPDEAEPVYVPTKQGRGSKQGRNANPETVAIFKRKQP